MLLAAGGGFSYLSLKYGIPVLLILAVIGGYLIASAYVRNAINKSNIGQHWWKNERTLKIIALCLIVLIIVVAVVINVTMTQSPSKPNSASSSNSTGIKIEGGGNCIIGNNTIQGFNTGINVQCANNTISNNTATH